MVLGAFDTSGRLAGIAPWYLKRSPAKGWVLRWLGSGEVCSDYASILSMPEDADRVTEALAAYLTGPNCAAGIATAGTSWKSTVSIPRTPASRGSCGSSTSGAACSMKTRRPAPGG